MALTIRWVTDAGAGAADGTSEANAMSAATFIDYMSTGGSFTATAGDVFNILGNLSSFTTTTHTFVNGGTATSPVVIRGVISGGSTAYAGRTNGNQALITTNLPQLIYTTGGITLTGSFIVLEALSIATGRSNYSVVVTTGTDTVVTRCVISNSSTNAGAGCISNSTGGSMAFDCDLNMTGVSGGVAAANITGVGSALDSCRIKVVSNCPAVLCASTSVIFGNTIYVSGGIGISMNSTSGRPFVRSNTVVGCAGDGINIITGATVLQRIIGNMITDNTGDGLEMTATTIAAFVAYNRFRDNATTINNGGDWITATSYGHVTTDTGGAETDYTNSSSNDYSLILTSPASNTGIPKYMSIGALQRNSSNTFSSTFVG